MSPSTNNEQQFREPIAVVGTACRFPGSASSPSKLWDLLHQPRDVVKEFDAERLNLNRFHHRSGDTHGATDVGNKSYLLEEDSRLFDASFFGISPMEAAGMDPQQRILLETVYEVFESAGVTLEQLRGSLTSVHVGCMTSDYANIQARDTETVAKYNATGSANSIMSNRISYVFDLKGPSETLDTACSSSLVALHNAALGLLNGDASTAVVCGVNLIFDPAPYINESKLHMLSPDSRSRMWDKAANGYARGEGAGAVLLKTLSQALKDGDHIEGVIRSTGVNSDGQSPGITMPFAPTQAALIRKTYARAGLDIKSQRPQYFECHGTGTKAGDPVEARAITEAFSDSEITPESPLYVGSIKTVIGHLEGGAGLAGVIKVLLAIKHRVIPPNLLFNELNPEVAPFYGPLQIPTTAIPWPELPAGAPARASVNSFGFGGTNSHAIIESYEAPPTQQISEEGTIGPLILSAKSGASLMKTVESYMEHIKQNPELDIAALSSVLQSKRSTHRVRAHFSGTSRDAIVDDMVEFLAKHAKATGDNIGHVPKLVNPREQSGVLGVFTGQGAQWPQMGRGLIDKSPVFRRTLEECDAVLAALPENDRPQWSLIKELTADAESSRIAEAALSQPLCTAVQLGLVNVLNQSGLKFDAVVGHSSGEIAATFAAGIITLHGAMQISYYRGLHAKLATGNEGKKGGMLAAGLSIMQAKEFVARSHYEGRIKVAASNAPRTVTFSGDLDAIEEAKDELTRDEIFARQLKVDTAYHSHHMLPCAEPYLESLKACNIEVRQPTKGACIWNSSVRGDTQLLRGDLSSLKGQYWVDNMVRTVLFSQAIESSIWHGGPYDLAVEVGPHPALKGPTEQTFKASYGQVPVYTGVLDRKNADVAAFSAAIGTAWAQLGPAFVNFEGYRAAFSQSGEAPAVQMIKDLPSYCWDHDKVYWREGRLSRRYRLGKDSGHELLGRRTIDDNEFELRWRNVLKLSEMPWLRGHEVLEEVLLPGASYVSIAAEAGKHLAADAGKTMSLLEVENIEILRPVVVPDNTVGVETLFTARVLEIYKTMVKAQFAYYVCPDETVGSMLQTCKGDLTIHIESPSMVSSADTLPPKQSLPPNLTNINTEQVYNLFKGIGLNYTGAFKSITDISRCLNYASTTGSWDNEALSDEYILHPAMLDVAFQTLFVAKAHPASRQITSALLPSHIDRVRVNPCVRILQTGAATKAEFETWAVSQTATSLKGDLNIYDASSGSTFLQVEGLAVNMVGAQESSSDRSMFSKTVWGNDPSVGVVEPDRNEEQDAKGMKMALAVERVAMFYVKRLVDQIPIEERKDFIWYHQRMFEAFENHIDVVQRGEHPIIEADWLNDAESVLAEIDAEYGEEIDMKLLHAVGNHLAEVVRGNEQLLEVMTKDDMLNRFYMEGYASIPTNKFIADTMKQITFKFPRAKILEIGAGTGGTSWSILNAIEGAYDSYTYTDISSGFFPNAKEKFADFTDKMMFKVLNVEEEPSEQGFEEESYDIIVAALVLHATHDLEKTMRHARSLLKPGGYLVMMELTGTTSVRATLVMGGLEGWWMGIDDGRVFTPLVDAVEWDSVLQRTGFSGADTVVCDLPDESKHCTSLILAQAVDDDFLRLREPMSFKSELPPLADPLLIVGGKKLWTSKVISEVQKLFPRSWKRQIQVVENIDKVNASKLSPRMDTIILQDADESAFATTMTPARISSLQALLMNSKNMLWITPAGKSQSARANLVRGITRVVPAELPHLNVQLLGLALEQTPVAAANNCVEAFLRLMQNEQVQDRNYLWAQEPELEILADGQTIVPRVIPDESLNEMYNVSKRAISKTVDASELAVQAVATNGKMSLEQVELQHQDSLVEFVVDFAVHIPGFDKKALYLIAGKAASSYSVALSEINASVQYIEAGQLVGVPEDKCTPDKLSALVSSLLVHSVSAISRPGQSALVYEADATLATDISTALETKGSRAQFASSRSDASSGWIKLHSLSSKRAIQRLIPHDTGLFVNCSNGDSGASQLVKECLKPCCEALHQGADMVRRAFFESDTPLNGILESCLASTADGSGTEVVAASELITHDSSSLAVKHFVIDWRKRENLTIAVKPLNTQSLFRADRTYFMAGMAGGLGLSICEWMIRNGAKNMVITSRNPKLSEATLEEARHFGANVIVKPMDLTKRESVQAVVDEVQKTMPPIAGVCNAAMVLKDGFFIDMDAEQLNNTLAAKVLGSENLDSVFGSTALDFFICLGSVASVIGNVGQSNYHAANMFMESLIQQRRERGLSASIIHIAYVTDVGYVTREERDRQLDSHFKKVRLMPTSETDVHHAFAEAVRGGKPGSVLGGHDIIMGIEPLLEPMPLDQWPLWMKDPRFAHFTPPTSLNSQQEGGGSGGSGNVKQIVEDAESEEEAVAAVTEAFCSKLETMLQLSAGSVNTSRPIIDLGIDSLVAVEIRTWFLKELGADIPVVKILGGDTVEQVSTLATKKLMAKIMETRGSQPKEDKPKKPEAQKQEVAKPKPEAPKPTLPAALPTPDDSRTPSRTASPPIEVRSVPADKGAVMIDVVKPDGKHGRAIVTERTVDSSSDSASTASDTESNSNQVADSRSQHSSLSSADSISGGIVTPPEFVREQRLSPAQARMWFVSKHGEDHTAYNMVFRYQVKGQVSITRLRHALATVVHHHEALRTCFFSRLGDGQPMQGVLSSASSKLRHVDSSGDEAIEEEMNRLTTKQWDLENGNTFEMVLLTRGSEDHECFFAYHHILMDVVGLGIILRDIHRAYKMQPLSRNPASYLDYSASQLQLLDNGALGDKFDFWRSEFRTFPETLPLLPVAKTNARSSNPGNRCHHTYRELKPEQVATLKSTCQRLRISPFHFHLATLQILLASYTNTEDLCLGIVDANRSDEKYAETVGYFVNMLPVRAHVPSNADFAAIASSASRKALHILTEAAVPFDMLLDQIKAPRSAESTPLFQAALNYRMGSIWEQPLGDAMMEMKDVKDANNPFDLSLGIAETPTGCVVELYGLASLYDAEACDSILNSYVRLLDTFCQRPNTRVADIQLYGQSEVETALSLGEGASKTYEWDTLSQRFMDIAEANPDNTALKFKDSSVTYSELASRVHSAAHALHSGDPTPGSRVAVLCEPSIDWIVAMLAILHVGAVYVPLDVSLPSSRHAIMVQTCKPTILMSHSATMSRVENLRSQIDASFLDICIDANVASESNVSCAAAPNEPAILLFTSGSTGTPKGIVLSQANFANHVALKADVLNFEQETVLQQSSLGFDMSLIQIFSALSNGGQLVIVPSETRRDPVEVTKLIATEGVSVTIATPSEYSSWLQYGDASLKDNESWRHACMGGEPIPQQLKTDLKRLGLHLQLTNCYGPTEITAAATFQPISLDDSVSEDRSKYAIGKAIPNYAICTIDADGRPQPVNHTGEICISGAGLALGYLDLPQESKRKFLELIPGQRWYKTGDQGRLLEDGTMLCFGRIDGDTQVKIRGLRVELEEVEAALINASEGLLSSAIVTRRGDTLVAHATSLQSPNDDELAGILARVQLPQYFVPASVSIISNMPMTSNGKVDRKAIAALPIPEQINSAPRVQEKMTVREGELRLLWERVLPKATNRIAPSSDFFFLGGNSMLLMKLQAAIKETMRIQASTRVLYQASTLREMAVSIEKLKEEQAVGDAELEIDWDAETAVPKWLSKQIHDLPSRPTAKSPKAEGIEILMTGATGFVGSHLLSSLISSPKISKVHCVAILADDQQLLPEHDKIVSYTGSLLSPTLGLNADEREMLEETADVIIHAGSSGHCLNTYPSLRTPNVLSTHFLASLSLRRSIPLMFLSSNRVVLLSGETAPVPGSVAAFHPSADGGEGHMMSRWASEVFLEKLSHQVKTANKKSSNFSIHRPSVVVSDQAPNSDALNAILRYSVSMRSVPSLDRVKGYMDLLPLEKLIDELSSSALSLATGDQHAGVHFKHHTGGVKVPADQLRSHLEDLYKVDFEELEMREWLSKASEAGMDPLITAYMEGILENDAPMVFAYMGEEAS